MEQEKRAMLDKANTVWAEYSALTPERLVELRKHYGMLSQEYAEMTLGSTPKKLEGEAREIVRHSVDLQSPNEFLKNAHEIFGLIYDFDEYRSKRSAEMFPVPGETNEGRLDLLLRGSEAGLTLALQRILSPRNLQPDGSNPIEPYSYREADRIAAAFVREMAEAAALQKPRVAHLSEDKKQEALDTIFQTSVDKIIAQLPEEFVNGILAAQLKINEAKRQGHIAASSQAEGATLELLGKISSKGPAGGRAIGGKSDSKSGGEAN